jgi:hypothetical protein
MVPAMAWTDEYAHVPGVPDEHRGDPRYETDYWDAYNEAWKIAWSCACRNGRVSSSDVVAWTQGLAHAIAIDFANVKHQLRQ